MRVVLALLLALPVARAQVSYQDLLQPDPADWLTYGRTYDSQRHTPLTEITKENVAGLAPAWIFPIPSAGQLQAVPVVVDGVMYVSAAERGLCARRPHRPPDLGVPPPARYATRAQPRRRRLRQPGLRRHARRAPGRARRPHRHRRLGRRDRRSEDGYCSPAAPFAIDGKIITGIAAGDYGLNGWLDAYDAETGERLWRWYTIPRPANPANESWAGDSWKTGGGDTWLTGSYDPELNLLYWGIGNPAPGLRRRRPQRRQPLHRIAWSRSTPTPAS